jgi:hypothetical protein
VLKIRATAPKKDSLVKRLLHQSHPAKRCWKWTELWFYEKDDWSEPQERLRDFKVGKHNFASWSRILKRRVLGRKNRAAIVIWEKRKRAQGKSGKGIEKL